MLLEMSRRELKYLHVHLYCLKREEALVVQQRRERRHSEPHDGVVKGYGDVGVQPEAGALKI